MSSRLDWKEKGVKRNEKRISHLRFADDVFSTSETAEETENMLSELNIKSKKDGLKMHMGKTKAMFKKFANKKDIMVEEKNIEHVNDYIYLGVLTKMERGWEDEINRRTTAGRIAFRKHGEILKRRQIP